MDEQVRQPLTLEQAKQTLRRQWIDGNPNLDQVVSQLLDSNETSLIELVLEDAVEALRSGKIATAEDYLSRFPQLKPNQVQLKAKLNALTHHSSLDSGDPQASGSFSFFSQSSIAQTQIFDSNRPDNPEKLNQGSSKRLNERAIPDEIGNFKIIRYIGRGSFGDVFEGIDKRLGRRVAIKVKNHSREKGLSDDFLHEARSISRLEHPNIVRLLQADETPDGVGYLVYEFVDGEMLQNRIERGDYAVEECVDWLASIADALDYAHRRGVVHRDISPRNIMIAKDGTARLLDFGLSSINGSFYKEDSNQILGTPAFISPEQASGNPNWATPYADIFSLGSVLYYALTRKLPFAGTSTYDTCERIQKAAPASLRSIRDDVTVKLEEACLRALAKEPQMRFSTGADMAAALINSLSVPTVRHGDKNAAPTYVLLAIGALVAIAGMAVTVVGLMGTSPKPITEIPEITDFDILVDQGGFDKPQRSMIYNDGGGGEISQGIISRANRLLVKADIPQNYHARLYHCRYDLASSESIETLRKSGTWTCQDFSVARSIFGGELTLGPNVFLLVCSLEESRLPDPEKLLQPLRFMEIARSANGSSEPEDTNSEEEQGGARNYLVFSKQLKFQSKDFWVHTVQQGVDASSSAKPLLWETRRVWNSPSLEISRTLINDLERSGVEFCCVAFFVDE